MVALQASLRSNDENHDDLNDDPEEEEKLADPSSQVNHASPIARSAASNNN